MISVDLNYDDHLREIFQNQEGFNFIVRQVHSIESAAGEINQQSYDSIILDAPAGEDCMMMAEHVYSIAPHIPVIVLTHSDSEFPINMLKGNIQHIVPKDYPNSNIITQAILSAIDRKHIENEIRIRDEILQAVNNAAEIFLTQSDWSSYLNEVLASLGKATQSDRVYVFSNMKGRNGSCIGVLKAEWVNENVDVVKTETIAEGVDYVKAGLGRWVKLMQKGEAIYGDVADLPAKEQPLLTKLGVKSLIFVPIFIDHTWWGFIGFDQCIRRSSWCKVEVDALRTAAKILGAAVSRQVTEEKLIYLATHDYLTDLPNRLLFDDRFRQAQARSERSGRNFAIISIDLDHFKVINDSYGHQFGDQVLAEVAKRLSRTVRGTDTCARIGGDEFAIIAEEIQNKADVMRVMEKISLSLQELMVIEEKDIRVSASMGASVYPIHGENLEELMKAADKTLYLIKGSSTRYKLYSDEQISWLKE